MSMHYARNKFRILDTVSSGDVSDLSAPPLQLHVYEQEAKHVQDVYSSGNIMHTNMKRSVRNSGNDCTRIITSSPSPPQSSISSDMLSQSSLEYHCDSDSQGCTEAYLCNQSANRLHGSHISDLSYVESPDSMQNYSSTTEVTQMGGENGIPYDEKSMKHMLDELKSVLLSPDGEGEGSLDFIGDDSSAWNDLLDEVQSAILPDDKAISVQKPDLPNSCTKEAPYPGSLSEYSLAILKENQGSRVKNLLIMCAAAIDEERLDMAASAMQELRKEVSVFGDPIERLAAYMSEGLVARLQASGLSIYRILKCSEAPKADVLSAMEKLYEICPYIKFGYMAANGAIAEAFEDEREVHIFDFQIGQGTQWFSLIQGLASRPGGPPSMRITTIEEKGSQGSSPISSMQLVEQKLSEFAKSFGVPFQFNCISSRLCDLQADMIGVRKGEALAVNFTLELHHVPDESVSLTNPRDRIIRMMKSLNPKVLTLVELEANTNTAPFLSRFMETLAIYSAIFESIDVAMPRESKDRVNVEEQCLARDIVNVIACEGLERIERHELLGKWRARMMMAGFRPRPLSGHVNSIIKTLLESYNVNYMLKEKEDALFLGWLNQSLIVASAWH